MRILKIAADFLASTMNNKRLNMGEAVLQACSANARKPRIPGFPLKRPRKRYGF